MVNVKEVAEIYRCEICSNVVEVKEVGGGEFSLLRSTNEACKIKNRK